jgi:hypothetical protein
VEEDRISGSEGEARAVNYFADVMGEAGFDVEIRETENYISLPVRASLIVLHPENREVDCITHSFSASTPEEGLEGDLIYVPGGGSSRDIRGKFVLAEGIAAPAPSWMHEQKGALGQLWINPGTLPHEMIITTIWGQPTPETAEYIPKNPVISMNKQDGEALKSLCERGDVRIRLVTETRTGFRQVPLAVAEVRGVEEPDKYVLFNAHIDSWHKGAADNGTANACMLETAQVVSKHRGDLRRGIRFVWWSGHSHGRYSGSNWYADHFWEDLYRNAVVNLNADALGCKGATDYSQVECSAELFALGKCLFEDYAGISPRYCRIGRSGDQSFWGIGLPSLFQLVSRQPPERASQGIFIPGLPWFWHTKEDTLDKIDREILLRDTRIYMAALWRMCAGPVLPFTFDAVADEFVHHLSEIQKPASAAFDLGPAIENAHVLQDRASRLKAFCTKVASEWEAIPENTADQSLEATLAAVNRCIMRLSRTLMPVNYCEADRFHVDRAVPIPPLPRLRQVEQLALLDPQGPPFKFMERKLLRERNRVCHALHEAVELIDDLFEMSDTG